MFRNGKYKNLGENMYNKKIGRLTGESAFDVLNYVIWLIRNIVYNLCYVCLCRNISSHKEEKKERTKRKNRKHENYEMYGKC